MGGRKMFGISKCKCCEALKSENKHLRELVDRVLTQIAPKPVENDATDDIIPEDE